MPTPGLPIPGSIGQPKQRISTNFRRTRKASKQINEVFIQNPTNRKRIIYALAFLFVFLLGKNYGFKSAAIPKPPFYVDKLPEPPSAPTGFSISDQRKIPPIVHYVFGLSRDFGGKPFGFAQFVAMNSMLENIHPDKVMIWYKYEPTSWWWGKIKEFARKKGVKWELKEARDVEEIL